MLKMIKTEMMDYDMVEQSPPSNIRFFENEMAKHLNKSPKRIRITFTQKQKHILEEAFKEKWFPDKYAKKKLAESTGLAEKNVKVWFQNRRQNVRKSRNKFKGIPAVSPYQPNLRSNTKSNNLVTNYVELEETLLQENEQRANPMVGNSIANWISGKHLKVISKLLPGETLKTTPEDFSSRLFTRRFYDIPKDPPLLTRISEQKGTFHYYPSREDCSTAAVADSSLEQEQLNQQKLPRLLPAVIYLRNAHLNNNMPPVLSPPPILSESFIKCFDSELCRFQRTNMDDLKKYVDHFITSLDIKIREPTPK